MEAVKWIGGGALAVVAYVVISNTLWLLIGSRILQSLPGVNIKGVRGTLKIAVMLVLAGVGLCSWTIKRPVVWLGGRGSHRTLPSEVSVWVGRGARWLNGLPPARRSSGRSTSDEPT
jgi:hypothetical protein